MSLANYTVPFAAPVAAPYLASHGFGGIAGAASAVNSLIYDRHSGARHPPPPPSYGAHTSPNRRHPTTDHPTNDPYRNQYPSRQRHFAYGARTDRFYSEPEYVNDKRVKSGPDEDYPSEESQVKKFYADGSNPQPTQSPRRGPAKRKPPEAQAERDWPDHPPGYTRIPNTFNSVPEPGAKTSIHAVLDFDDDFDDYSYEDEGDGGPHAPAATAKTSVTPIEGPILIKNGSVPVVPLYSYPTINNGSLVQIPILWTALSLALGLEIRGEIIRGVPCIKRYHQLFCPTAGNSYPIERIERFIDDNKALMKRMYGEFQMSSEFGPPAKEIFENRRRNVKREAGDDDNPNPGSYSGSKSDSYFAKHRQSRQSFRNNQNSESGRVDACESKIEIVTPYWASNSAGKVRAIVNTQHFEQAIHQEVCSKVQTKRCVGDCGCEQKYKWHRLLAYDPDNDCKGIFMDWFLFPSCCVCRCAPTFGN